MVRLFLQRHKYGNETIGTLFLDGLFFSYTLEDRVRLVRWIDGTVHGTKVMRETAIPAGRYRVRTTASARFKKDLVLIEGVPQFTGVRFHGGMTADDTEGCVLVAESAFPTYIAGRAVALSQELAGACRKGGMLEVADQKDVVQSIYRST